MPRLCWLFHLSLVSLLCLVSFSHSMEASGKAQGGVVTLELWCVAKNNAEDSALQSALDWACGPGGADCSPIQNGGPCYDAQDLQRTASYAFNDYYLKHGLSDDACDFSNTAALISLDPSHGSCKFPSSYSVNNASYSTSSSTSAAGYTNADTSSSTRIIHSCSWSYLISLHLFFTILRRIY
uniref:X8 domain-containing protein n=1 Tax=Kalanchoe fedtschenkoi TaxID=63787 RepID=A0A7N0TJN4_KALFE